MAIQHRSRDAILAGAKKVIAEVLQKDKLRMTVRPDGTKIEIFLVRGDTSIPYRGRHKGQYFTVQDF